MMKLAILSATIAAATAFAPSGSISSHSALHSTPTPTEEVETVAAAEDIPADIPQPVAVAAINGWVPDETANCYGLPGAVAPSSSLPAK